MHATKKKRSPMVKKLQRMIKKNLNQKADIGKQTPIDLDSCNLKKGKIFSESQESINKRHFKGREWPKEGFSILRISMVILWLNSILIKKYRKFLCKFLT